MSYVLISPIKDEENNIHNLKDTVMDQNLKPLLWIIIDSNSSDDSFELTKELTEDYNWIHVIKQKKILEKGYGHINFAQAINEGYKHAKRICNKNRIEFNYIGKLDAAVSLQKNYFEVLNKEMDNNANLAFTWGVAHFIADDNKMVVANPSKRSKTVGAQDQRLYRKDFFEEMNGYTLNYSPDTILMIKAFNRNYDVKCSEDTFYEKRRLGGIGGTRIGVWKAYKLKGKAEYVLGYDAIYMFLNSFYIIIHHPPHYQGLAIIYGFIISFIKRDKKIDDKEITDYFGKRLIRDFKSIFSVFRSKFK